MSDWQVIEKKYKQADHALDQNNPHKAARLLRDLVKSEPEEPLFHWLLGYALSEMNEYQGAIQEFQEALKLDPKNVAAWGCLGRTYMELEAWGPAEQALTARLALKKSPQHYVFLANVMMEMDRYDSAIECCRKAIELDPSFGEAFLNLGLAYRHEKQLDKAIAAIKKATELDTDYFIAFRELGLTYYYAARTSLAIQALQTCLAMSPNDAWGHFYFALCLEKSNEPKLAARHFRRAQQLAPENTFFQRQFEEFQRNNSSAEGVARPASKQSETGGVDEIALAHILATTSGRKILSAAAQHFTSKQRFTRAELAEVLDTDEATIFAWIRQLGRPEKRFGFSTLQRHDDGSYSLSKQMRDAILRILRGGRK